MIFFIIFWFNFIKIECYGLEKFLILVKIIYKYYILNLIFYL